MLLLLPFGMVLAGDLVQSASNYVFAREKGQKFPDRFVALGWAGGATKLRLLEAGGAGAGRLRASLRVKIGQTGLGGGAGLLQPTQGPADVDSITELAQGAAGAALAVDNDLLAGHAPRRRWRQERRQAHVEHVVETPPDAVRLAAHRV